MREVEGDKHFPDDPTAAILNAVRKEEPTEAELVIISLLMRLYDINLALLNHFDEVQANRVYDGHATGDHFNPPMYLPQMTEIDESKSTE